MVPTSPVGGDVALSQPQAEAPARSSEAEAVLQLISGIKAHVAEIAKLHGAGLTDDNLPRLKEVVDAVDDGLEQLQRDLPSALETPALTRILHELHQVCEQFSETPGFWTKFRGQEIEYDAKITWVIKTCEAMTRIAGSNIASVSLTHIATLAHAITFLPNDRGRAEALGFLSRIEPMLNVGVAAATRHLQELDEQHCAERVDIGMKMEQVLKYGCEYPGRDGEPCLKVAVGVFGGLVARIVLPKLRVSDHLDAQVAKFNQALGQACDRMGLTTQANIQQAKERKPDADLVSQVFSAFFPGFVVEGSHPSASTAGWLSLRFG